jgi:hypothetical protein
MARNGKTVSPEKVKEHNYPCWFEILILQILKEFKN